MEPKQPSDRERHDATEALSARTEALSERAEAQSQLMDRVIAATNTNTGNI